MLEEAQVLLMLGMALFHDAKEMRHWSLDCSHEDVQQTGRGKSNAREAASPQQSSRLQPFLDNFAGYGKAFLLTLHPPWHLDWIIEEM